MNDPDFLVFLLGLRRNGAGSLEHAIDCAGKEHQLDKATTEELWERLHPYLNQFEEEADKALFDIAVSVLPGVPAKRTKPSKRRASATYTIETRGDFPLKAHIGIGFYPNGKAAELFVNVATVGSFLNTVFDVFALLASRSLQWGMPLSEVAKAVRGVQDGSTKKMIDSDGKKRPASSLWDAIAQTLEGHHTV